MRSYISTGAASPVQVAIFKNAKFSFFHPNMSQFSPHLD
jgi:hypothetical protein